MVATQGDYSHTFCSYARVDHQRVIAISELLRTSGLPLWIDTEAIEPAADWMAEVERAIDGADAFVLFLSPAYLNSSVCLAESQRAREDGKRVIPVLISEVSNFDGLPWVQNLNWIIATDTDDDQRVVDEIVRAARTDSNWANQHRELLVSARAWDQADRRKSRLLRGTDLQQAQLALGRRRMPDDPQPAEIQLEYLAASITHQTRRRRLAVILAVAVIATSSGLGILARLQANIANSEREVAAAERDRAERERQSADEQRVLADAAREQADEARQIAEEQEQAALDSLATAQRLQGEAEAQVLAFESLRETDPSWASLLAIESMYRSQPPVPSAVEAWLRATYELNSHVLLPIDIVSWGADTNSFLSPRGDLVYVSNEESAELRTSAGETVHSDLPAGAATWHPNGTAVMVQGDSSVFMIAADGTVRQEYPSSTVSFAEWSPDGRWLAGRAGDRTVVFFVTESLSLEVAYQAPAGVSRPYFAWYPSGELMAISEKEILGDSPTGIITVVDLLTGESNFGTSPEIAGRIAWKSPAYVSSPSLRYSVTDGSVATMSAERLDGEGFSGYHEFGQFSGAPISVLQTPPAGSRNIEPLIAREDGVIQLGRDLVRDTGEQGPILFARWHPSSKMFLAASLKGELIIGDLDGNDLGGWPMRMDGVSPRDAAWVSSGTELLVDWSDGTLTRFQFDSSLAERGSSESSAVTTHAWAPSSGRLATGNENGEVTLIDPSGAKRVLSYQELSAFVQSSVWEVTWSPDGRWLTVEFLNGALSLLDTNSLASVPIFDYRWSGPTGISWSPTSDVFVAMHPDDGPVFVSTDGSVTTEFGSAPQFGEMIADGRFLADGGLIFLGYEGGITLTDDEGRAQGTLEVAPYSGLGGGSLVPITVNSSDGVRMMLDDFSLTDPLSNSPGWQVPRDWSHDRSSLALFIEGHTVRVVNRAGDILQDIEINSRSQASREGASILWLSDRELLTTNRDGDSFLASIDTGTAAPSPVSTLEPARRSESGRFVSIITASGYVQRLTTVSTAETCQLLVALLPVDELPNRTGLSLSSAACVADQPLEGDHVTGLTIARSDLGQAADLSTPSATSVERIRDRYQPPAHFVGPVEAGGRYFIFAAESMDPYSGLELWQFIDGGWQAANFAVEQRLSWVESIEVVEVTGDDISEVLVRWWGNDLFGYVFAFRNGYWFEIGWGEGLQYSETDGLHGTRNDCDPNCADGNPVYYELEWNGFVFVER